MTVEVITRPGEKALRWMIPGDLLMAKAAEAKRPAANL
jgi:hypothetical protein